MIRTVISDTRTQRPVVHTIISDEEQPRKTHTKADVVKIGSNKIRVNETNSILIKLE